MKHLLITLTLGLALTACSQEYPEKIYSPKGIAIDGYDPVSYFTEGKAIQGTAALSLEWNEAVWHFSTEENRALFKANPEQYAPQYGGYCAYGMGNGYKAKVDPKDAWTVADGKLYLNYNPKVKTTWQQDQQGWISKADEHWKKFE